MYKKSKFKIIISFLLLFIITFSFILNSSTVFASNNNEEKNINLVIDNLNSNIMPSHFRTTSDISKLKNNSSLNLSGLDKLNASGSQQFSKNNISLIKNAINTSYPLTIIDLRQESHGFVNGVPVSFKNENNNANIGLTNRQVVITEKKDLSSIKLNVPLTFHNHPEITITPTEVKSEKEITKDNSLNYIRIPVTDGGLPDDSMVDYFIDVVKECSKDMWFHFHCKEGVGRTTTFMIMYDMMKNYKEATADEIIQRQFLLANFSDKDIESFSSPKRISFLHKFYEYCKQTDGNYNTKWSTWITTNQNK
ncbi:hypothetical protein UT300005_22290 [Clostridium sp. CTA-5]